MIARRRWQHVALGAAFFLSSGHAGADDTTDADALFTQGRDLLERGKFGEACQKLSASERLSPAVGTLLNLGYCWEQLGRFRSAMDAYAEADVLATKIGDAKRAEFARERFAAVQPRVAKLIVRIADPEQSGLEVTRNDVVMPSAEWNVSVPVDPEEFVIRAHAPGKVAWRAVVHTRGEGAVTMIVVPPLSDPVAEGVSSISTLMNTQRIAAMTLGAGALAAFGAGTALALSAKARHEDSLHHCDGSGCDATGVEIQENAVAAGNVATVLFLAGLVFVGTGTWLWLTGAPSQPRSARITTPLGVRF